MNGRVEVEFEYVPGTNDPVLRPTADDNIALGVLLELAAHAVHTTVPGGGIRDLRFGTPLRLSGACRCSASVDPGTGRLQVTSVGLSPGESAPVTHLIAKLQSPPARGRAVDLEPAAVNRGGVPMAAREIEEFFPRPEHCGPRSPLQLERVVWCEDGIDAQIQLSDARSEAYRLHPTAIDGGWQLARLWFSRQGVPAIAPLTAEAVRVLRPGSKLTRIRLFQVRAARDGAVPTVSIVLEADHGIAAVIEELKVGGTAAQSGLLGAVVRGELQQRIRQLDQRARKGGAERYVASLVAGALLIDPDEVPLDIPVRDLGFSSLLASEFAASLGHALDREVPMTLAFDHPTIAQLSGALLDLMTSAVARPATVRAQAPREATTEEPIAVVGMACRLPGGLATADQLMAFLRAGGDTIGPVPVSRIGLIGAFENAAWSMAALEDIEQFDPRFFGISDQEAQAMDPQQRILLETAWHALERAGIVPDSLANSATGVFLGASVYGYAMLLREYDAYSAVGNEPSAVAGRLSYCLGLRGPSLCVDTACSSSLVAVSLACDSLRRRETDLAIAGGVNLILDPRSTQVLQAAGVLSPSGRARTFDRDADGYVRGEGCGVVLLRRLSDAQRDGEPILAVVRGTAVAHGGRGNGLAAPNRDAQAELIRTTLARSAIEPSEVGYVEAHGAATPLGDAIELQALADTYGAARGRSAPAFVGSVKPNIGHLEAAAGIAGFMKAVLTVQYGEIPANLNLRNPNAQIDWQASGLAIPAGNCTWPAGLSRRVAAINSFGMSGTYAHVIVEAAPEPAPRTPIADDGAPMLVTVSAKTKSSARALARAYAAHLRVHGAERDLSFTSVQHRQHMPVRAAVVGRTAAELVAGLDDIAAGASRLERVSGAGPRLLFAYPGHGSHYAGMGRELFEREPVFAETLEECDRALRDALGCSLIEALYAKDSLSLQHTRIAHPALVAIEVALTRLWQSWGVTPDCVVGHSLGEYAAAIVAGTLTLEHGLQLAAVRARLMASAPQSGAMAAINAESVRVQACLDRFAGAVVIAAVNAPDQVVVSGLEAAVVQVCAEFEANAVRTHRIPITHGAHSPLMDPILAEFEAAAAALPFSSPKLPFVSSVTAEPAAAALCAPRYWREQLRRPVQFHAALQRGMQLGMSVVLEIGAHPVLMAAAAESLASGQRWLPSLRRGSPDREQLLTSLGALYELGLTPNWRQVSAISGRHRPDVPTYAFEHQRCWLASIRGAGDAHAAGDPNGGAERSGDGDARNLYMQRLTSLGADERQLELEQRIRLELQGLLTADCSVADLDRSFCELRLDSLGSIQLRSRLERLTGVPISNSELRDHASAPALARHVLAQALLAP